MPGAFSYFTVDRFLIAIPAGFIVIAHAGTGKAGAYYSRISLCSIGFSSPNIPQ
jgi:hypothetical protein